MSHNLTRSIGSHYYTLVVFAYFHFIFLGLTNVCVLKGTNSTKVRFHQANTIKQARPSTRYLSDEFTDDESSGSVKEYIITEVVEPINILPRGTKGS